MKKKIMDISIQRLFTFLFSGFAIVPVILSSFCGNNKIPYGIEVYKDGQPSLLCSRPGCFEKTYAVRVYTR